MNNDEIIVDKVNVTKCPHIRYGMIYAICTKYNKFCLNFSNCMYKRWKRNENNSGNTKL